MKRYFSSVVESGSSNLASVELCSDTANEPPQQQPSPASEEVLQSTEDETNIMDNTHTQLTKRRQKGFEKFASEIKKVTGLDLMPAPSMYGGRAASKCATCSMVQKETIIVNVKKRWMAHAKTCTGLLTLTQNAKLVPITLSAEAQAFRVHLTAGGESHRKNTCDAYVLCYWLYKHKLPFTTGDKLREVPQPLLLHYQSHATNINVLHSPNRYCSPSIACVMQQLLH